MAVIPLREVIPLVEFGIVPEVFFTGWEVEIVAQKCARFVLYCQQTPVGCGAIAPENVVKMRLTTLTELVPGMIQQATFALSPSWRKSAGSQIVLPG